MRTVGRSEKLTIFGKLNNNNRHYILIETMIRIYNFNLTCFNLALKY